MQSDDRLARSDVTDVTDVTSTLERGEINASDDEREVRWWLGRRRGQRASECALAPVTCGE